MKLKLSQIRLIIFGSSLLLLAAGGGYWWGIHQVKLLQGQPFQIQIERKLPEDKKGLNFSLFWEVWDRLNQNYLDKTELKPTEMILGAIKGMVASLGDPYTAFLPPEENKQVKEDLNGRFEGVGIELGYQDGNLSVIAPLKGMPAEKVGVRAGDLILKIGDKETGGMSLPEAVKLIRGPKNTTIELTLLHQGEKEPYLAAIVRATIIISSAEVEFDGQVAHLRLTRFGDRTKDEWNQAVAQIKSRRSSLSGLILDLRNNPGGYLSGAVFIASEFLPSDSESEFGGVVVQQEFASGKRETFSVDRLGQLTSLPLVVLVNQGSASASEIVAGALQDYQRAKVVGTTTFGKGTIQEAQDLAGGSGLHITIARWLLPSGKSIKEMGIKPDYEVEDDLATEEIDEALEKAIAVLLE